MKGKAAPRRQPGAQRNEQTRHATPRLERRAFPAEALPEPFRGFVTTSAKAIGCDPSYVALPLLAAAASAIGTTRRIRLKRGWEEPPIVWAAIVGESGTMKSPPIDLALRAVRERQRKAMRDHAEAMARYREDRLRYERDLAAWKGTKAPGDPPAEPEQPIAIRYWTDDATTEAVALLLAQQPRGLLMVRDELAGWIRGFDRYAAGRGGDAAKWLETYGGRPMIVDRKTSEPIHVPVAAVSIIGSIPPETLRSALGAEHRENGLAARLLLAWPPRRRKRWSEADIDPNTEAAVAAIFDRLYALEPDHDGDGEPRPVMVSMTTGGKAAWVKFFNAHADEQANLGGDLAAAWSKLEAYAARLAVVVHFVRWAAGDPTLTTAVDEASMTAGVALCRWFGFQARQVYGMLTECEADTKRRRLVEWIEQRGGCVTVRDMTHNVHQYRGDASAAKTDLDDIAGCGFGQWEHPPPGRQGGRPSMRFRLITTGTDTETPAGRDVSGGIGGGVTGQSPRSTRVIAAGLIREARRAGDGELAQEMRDRWGERVAICESDGGLSLPEAEAVALDELRLLANRQG